MQIKLILIILAVAVPAAGFMTLIYFRTRRLWDPFATDVIVRERIRREVEEEFEQRVRQSSGIRRWWLLARREVEISTRTGRILHGEESSNKL